MPTRVVAFALVLCLAPVTSAQEEPPTIEAMLAEAEEQARKEASKARSRFLGLVQMMKLEGDGAEMRRIRARREAAGLGFGVIPAVIETLTKTKNWHLARQLGLTLIEMRKMERATADEIAAPLRELIDAGEAVQVATAIQTLGNVGDTASAAAIKIKFGHESKDVRAAVVLALARLGAPGCNELYETAAGDEEPLIRWAAARAYRLCGRHPEDARIMIALTGDSDLDVKMAALRSLERIALNSKAIGVLHDTLAGTSPDLIEVAIEVIERIGRKELSGRHLMTVVKRTEVEWDLRVRAARAMYRLGSKDGMDELTKSFKANIARNPKGVTARESLAAFYVEFEAWDEAAKAYKRALQNSRRGMEQNRLRLELARCYARDGSFKNAAKYLRQTGRDNVWRDLANDPAFAEMRKDRRYAKQFGTD